MECGSSMWTLPPGITRELSVDDHALPRLQSLHRRPQAHLAAAPASPVAVPRWNPGNDVHECAFGRPLGRGRGNEHRSLYRAQD